MAPVLALFLHEESIEDGTEVFGVTKVLCLLDEVCALKKKIIIHLILIWDDTIVVKNQFQKITAQC
jgi:hypothetical protein